jgi:hypothetical protein
VKDQYLIINRELELLAVQVPHTEFEMSLKLDGSCIAVKTYSVSNDCDDIQSVCAQLFHTVSILLNFLKQEYMEISNHFLQSTNLNCLQQEYCSSKDALEVWKWERFCGSLDCLRIED